MTALDDARAALTDPGLPGAMTTKRADAALANVDWQAIEAAEKRRVAIRDGGVYYDGRLVAVDDGTPLGELVRRATVRRIIEAAR